MPSLALPNWRNELHGAPPGGLVSLHMTALVARVQGLGTRARRCRLWRHVVRRDSAVQEGLHEHTPARITSRRGSRHHGIDGGSLALGTTTTSMACIAACIACLWRTAMATSYNLCTYSIISTPVERALLCCAFQCRFFSLPEDRSDNCGLALGETAPGCSAPYIRCPPPGPRNHRDPRGDQPTAPA